jgi:MFS family permease
MSADVPTVGTATVAVPGEPVARVGRRWSSTYALVWLGVWMAQLAPVQYLLPLQVKEVFGDLPDAQWKQSVLDFGLISGVAAIFSLIAYPLTGALSDRTTARMGRRRPWILAGAALFAGSLVLLSLQHGLAGVTTFWSLAMVGFCAMSAGLTALISDQVPVTQRGWVSGLISAPQAVGVIVGVLIVTAVVTGRVGGYVTIAALLVVFTVPFVSSIHEERGPVPTTPLTPRSVIAGFWISPRQHPDFGWTLLSRVLVNVGNALATSLLFYFLLFGLDRSTADDDILVLSACTPSRRSPPPSSAGP